MKNRIPAACYALPRAAVIFLIIAGLALSGCASRGGRTYNDGDAREVQTVQFGSVTDVTEVQVEEDSSLFGPLVGSVAGGVVGSVFGGGSGRVLATLGGALGGALLGGAAEAYARTYPATQLTIELENGDTILIVQGNDEFFVRGDSVRVVFLGDGRARVQHRQQS